MTGCQFYLLQIARTVSTKCWMYNLIELSTKTLSFTSCKALLIEVIYCCRSRCWTFIPLRPRRPYIVVVIVASYQSFAKKKVSILLLFIFLLSFFYKKISFQNGHNPKPVSTPLFFYNCSLI